MSTAEWDRLCAKVLLEHADHLDRLELERWTTSDRDPAAAIADLRLRETPQPIRVPAFGKGRAA
jgi:hypothetical protein